MGENTVNFNAVSDMLERISKSKKPVLKRKTFRTFLDHFYTDRSYFSVMRLILPHLDRDRGNYGLKESVLAKCLADALGLARDSPDADRLLNWRRAGAQAGKNAGNFALIAAEIVGSRQSRASGNLKVSRVNHLLDQLAEVKPREQKSKVLAELINKTNAVEMKWLIMIILKDLKLGISEKTVFKEFHPDADEVFNKTCDLKLVCEKLVDPGVRYKRQDIEVGKPVRPQLACRVRDVEEAWKKLRGKRVIAECKFDGDRCQVHKDGSSVNFFSRSSIDHKEFADAMSGVICESVKADKCILDGEMVVWNRVTCRFAEFGTIQEVAKRARDGVESDEQLCYIVFDVLYMDDCSVIHQPLVERQRLLREKVRTVSGRLELLQPDKPNCGGQVWSISASSAGDVERFFQTSIENREEGIVVKDFDSKWEPGDRSGKWLKLKPDYVHPESDLDVLIIGGYYGSGRRGGDVAQFLLGLAERPLTGYPTKFLSFCKVGTGLTDDECRVLVDKLRPYFKKYDKNGKPPSYYVVTNNAKERPDVWIDQPDKSVILQIASDIRCIKSEVFASPHSLRFPRVHRVRYDKPWYECLDVQSLNEMVAKGNGNFADVTEQKKRKKQEKTPKKKTVRLPLLEARMQQTDVTNVKKISDLFRGLMFVFINVSPADQARFHCLVAEYGGGFSMNINGDVTHVIAESRKGLLYETAAKRGDVIHRSWFLDSIEENELLPLRPKYMLHLSFGTKQRFQETIDEFGDHYFVDVDEDDLKQLFGYMREEELSVEDADVLEYKKKFGGEDLFQGCRLYFHHPAQPLSDDRLVADVVLRKLEVEVQMRSGAVNSSLRGATHAIVYWDAENQDESLFSQKLLLSEKISVLSHTWLVDALERGSLPYEDGYVVKSPALLETSVSPPKQQTQDDVEISSAASACNEDMDANVEMELQNRDETLPLTMTREENDDGATLFLEELLGTSSLSREDVDKNTVPIFSTVPHATCEPLATEQATVEFEPDLNTFRFSPTVQQQTICDLPSTSRLQESQVQPNGRSHEKTQDTDMDSTGTFKLSSAPQMDALMMDMFLPESSKLSAAAEEPKAVTGREKRREEEPAGEMLPLKKKTKTSYKDKIAGFL